MDYEFLKQLLSSSLDFLLHVFNEIWVSGKFPTSWKQATIMSIPKPGNDSTGPSNYRPIALTCCRCKTLERMINTRLIYTGGHKFGILKLIFVFFKKQIKR